MARRKTRTKKRRRSRSRMGAIGRGGDLGLLLAVAGGTVAGKFATSKITGLSPTIMGAAQAVGGFVLSRMRQPILKGVGIGLFANGVVTLSSSFGLLNGIGAPVQFRDLQPKRNITPLISGRNGAGMNYDDDTMGRNTAYSPELRLISGMFDDFS